MSQKFASATTLAGRRRQVWEGRAQLTGPNGLSKSQLTQNRQGKIVSLAKSSAAGLSGGARRRKMKLTEFYDLVNRKRVTVAKKNIKKDVSKNGRHRLVAKHNGRTLFKFVSESVYCKF